jgi:hypothetical protein
VDFPGGVESNRQSMASAFSPPIPDTIALRRRATAGLILLAVVDLACYAARARWTAASYGDWLSLPQALQSAEHHYWTGQQVGFGIAAALIPTRRYVGLAATAVLAVASGAIHAWCLVMIHESRATVPLDMSHIRIQFAATADIVLATFVFAQGLRFVGGWSIGFIRQANPIQSRQFRLGDLVEWTASVAAWLAVLRLHWFAWSGPGEYLLHRLTLIALVLPIALYATSPGKLRPAIIMGLLCWIVAVEATGNLVGYLATPSAFAYPWRLLLAVTVGSMLGTVLAAALNFLVVRWLGFRWRRAGHDPHLP